MKRLTTEEFIEKAQKIHGNKYDYSNVDYNGNRIKVEVICSIHGNFKQSPVNHLNGSGCPKCARNIRLTTSEFIKRAKEIHGDKYDYSKSIYKSYNNKIIIICSIHGEFQQKPNEHLRGCGCPKCARNVRLTTSEFIERAKKIHGNKYNYFNIIYRDYYTKVKIICKKHGIFKQMPIHHLKGSGCPKCAKNFKLTTKGFIKKAKKIHGNKYDYSNVNYNNNRTKVEIICSIHGKFKQSPVNHLSGNGCQKCARNIKLTTSEFIERAKKIHGDEYDYSNIKYKNNHTKIIIICKKHGEFKQTPMNHLNRDGCPICNNKSKGEKIIRGFLKTKKINFIYQKKYSDCKNKRCLPFDFYIKEKNILIEYDGKQHYEPISFGSQSNTKIKQNFKKTQQNDKIKTEYAKKNNIKLIRIPYTKFNDIEKILTKELLV